MSFLYKFTLVGRNHYPYRTVAIVDKIYYSNSSLFLYKIKIPKDDSVRLLSYELDKLNYTHYTKI